MGNRAVIAFGDPDQPDTLGIYLHWNGGRASVEAFLTVARDLGIRGPLEDDYAPARLCQIVGNFFAGSLSLGIGLCRNLDCDNHDNGTYIIGDDWQIVGRRYIEPAAAPILGQTYEEEIDPAKTAAIVETCKRRQEAIEAAYEADNGRRQPSYIRSPATVLGF